MLTYLDIFNSIIFPEFPDRVYRTSIIKPMILFIDKKEKKKHNARFTRFIPSLSKDRVKKLFLFLLFSFFFFFLKKIKRETTHNISQVYMKLLACIKTNLHF